MTSSWHGRPARGLRYAASIGRTRPIQATAQRSSFIQRKSRLRDCLYRWDTIDKCGIPHFMGWKPMPRWRTASHGRQPMPLHGTMQVKPALHRFPPAWDLFSIFRNSAGIGRRRCRLLRRRRVLRRRRNRPVLLLAHSPFALSPQQSKHRPCRRNGGQ